MSLSKNIRYLRKQKGMSQDELAEKLNYKSYTTIQKWESGVSEPPLSKTHELANIFDVSINKLVNSDLEVSEDEIDLNSIPGIIHLQKTKRVPILGTIACGEPIFAQENYEGYFILDSSMTSADFILKAKGESMIEANIHDGDLVFLRKTPDVENGSIAAVLIENEATLKRVNKSENTIILQPCNKNYAPIVVSDKDHKSVLILGEMVGVYSQRSR